nr:ADP-glyceromanno-heptose 6-epimerase [uncultured Schaedlerella sp.]
MSVIVTGGAGFIGSCLVRMLNDKGIEDILIVDNIAGTEKWKNLINKKYLEYIHKDAFLDRLQSYKGITHILHMGACSSTTEKDFDYLCQNNLEYTKALWTYCTEHQIHFIYASSAATYGDGRQGFSDQCDIKELRPLNGYGYSKQLFDLWVEKQQSKPAQYVGLKFFNVYGPNEYYKDAMASVIFHGYRQVKESGRLKLFKSCHPDYADGGQLRDFVYVKDICKVIGYFMDQPEVCGLFNVGTGRAESFEKLGESVFKALGRETEIDYIEMPEKLRKKYQYYTRADMDKLKAVGYSTDFYSLEDGIVDYVQNYLEPGFRTY